MTWCFPGGLLRRGGWGRVTDPHDITPELRQELIDCWIAVTNAGGAAGFPFPPVGEDDVAPAADKLLGRLNPQQSRLLIATTDSILAGWVVLNRDPYRLVGHWGTVHHLQTCPNWRGRGIGAALAHELRKIARDELGWNSCISRPGEARGWSTSTDGSDGVRSVAGPKPSGSHPTTPATRSSCSSPRSDHGGIRTVPIPDVTSTLHPHVGKGAAGATTRLVPLRRKAEAEDAARKAEKAQEKAQRAKKAGAGGKTKAKRKKPGK